MEKYFCIGLALGMLGGALIATNSYKTRQVIRDGSQKIKTQVEKMSDKNGKEETSEKSE